MVRQPLWRRRWVPALAQLVVATWAYWATIYWWGRSIKYAATFSPDMIAVEAAEARRRAWAQQFWRERPREVGGAHAIAPALDSADSDDLCVAIVTAPRRPSYLLETAASVMQSVEASANGARVTVVVNDVGPGDPGTNPGEQLAVLQRSRGLHVVRAPGCSAGAEVEGAGGARCSNYRKESLDYAASLRLCLNLSSASLVCVVEDDALLALDFVDGQLAAGRRLAREDPSWLFVKLFRTAHFDGFSADAASVRELVLAGAVVAALCLALVRPRSGGVAAALARVALVWPQSSASLHFFGRQNTLWPLQRQLDRVLLGRGPPGRRRGLKLAPDDPGTIAVLFPRPRVSALAQHLRLRTARFETDLALNDLLGEQRLSGYVARPNLAEHLGRRSSLAPKTGTLDRMGPQRHYARFFKQSEWFDEAPGRNAGPYQGSGAGGLPLVFVLAGMLLLSWLASRVASRVASRAASRVELACGRGAKRGQRKPHGALV